MGGHNHDAQGQQGSPYGIMSKRLTNSDTFTINCDANKPIACPFEIGYCRMLEFSVTVWTDNQQVTRVMANLWVKMMYFKVGVTVSFFESERAKLALSIVKLSK